MILRPIPLVDKAPNAIPVTPVEQASYKAVRDSLEKRQQAWLAATGFEAKPGKVAFLPGADGSLERVLLGVKPGARWTFASLPAHLPKGVYTIEGLDADAATRAAIDWALGGYKFDRYRQHDAAQATLAWPETADRAYATAAIEAISLVRDLVNTPANDLGPAELAAAAEALAGHHGATFTTVSGAALEKEYPAIHAVGFGSPRAPCLIDFSWGYPAHPKLTLVGKGVCFDTGGLDLKPSSGMLIMKKDMGGAAHALGLAHLIMSLGLKLRLRVLIPAVENSTSGRAMRPGDIFKTRKGLTVEIGNTDAEGRVVLADALEEASRETPQAIIDFATLTGAARVALGPELPAYFCNDEAMAQAMLAAAVATDDPFWRLPLWQNYAADVDSKIADVNNNVSNGFAGSIYAALFLERFVGKDIPWAHFDVYAWNAKPRPGRPEGGEAFALHACYAYATGLQK
jgi:leucyl aminopeptidase